MTKYKLTVFLDNGTAIVTEESFDEDDEQEVIQELVDRIEDRDDPWKTLGNLTLHFKHISGFAVEALFTKPS